MAYTHIIHIADIHIRNGNRENSKYDQYIQAFQNLNTSIRKQIQKLNAINSVLIVVAGDIFHNKNKVENFGLKLLKIFINTLTKIAPTIIIPGNHDLQQQYPDEPGLLDSCIYDDNPNLYYLSTTTSISFNNVGISTISVKDTLVEGEGCGIKENLPNFPRQFDNTVSTTVALFHGSFGKTKLNEKQEADEQNSYPLDMLKGFDIATLGDIHLPQHNIHQECSYAYSGSLIQQNFGENIIDHGYVIWDIKTKTPKFKNVYNDIGYITCSNINDTWMIKYKGLYTDINTVIQNSYFPKKPIIRIDGNTNHIDKLFKIFQQHNIYDYTMNCITDLNKNIQNYSTQIKTLDIDLNDPQYLIKYMKNNNVDQNIINDLNIWIKNPEVLLIDQNVDIVSISNLANRRNPTINKLIDDYKQAIDVDSSSTKHTFSILDLKFSHTLCYGNKNHIDFSKCKNSTLLINGKNACGKSALYEIICYAIFGKPMKSRECPRYSAAFINVNKPSGSKCFTNVTLSTKLHRVELYREYYNSFDKDNKSNVLKIHKTSLKLHDNNNNLLQNISGTKAIAQWINTHIGTIDDFLKTSMVTQDIDENILKLSPKQIKSYIDANINIDAINKFQLLINEVNNTYKYVNDSINDTYTQLADTIHTNIDEKQIKVISDQIKDVEFSITELKNTLEHQLFIDYNQFSYNVLESDIEQKLKLLQIPNITQDVLKKEKIIYEQQLDLNIINEFSSKYSKDTQNLYNDTLENEPEKPQCDLHFVNDLYTEIKDIQIIQKPKIDIDTINQNIKDLQLQIKEHNINEPEKINKCKLEYSSIQKITKHINKLFGSISSCYNIYSNYEKHNMIFDKKYTIDLDNIDQINQIQKDLKTVNDTISEQTDNLNSLYEKETTLNNLFLNIKHISEPEFSLDEAKQHVNKCNKLERSYSEKLDEYNYLKDLIDMHDQLLKKIEEHSESLKLYKDIEYNPDCKICMKQQFVKKKLNIEYQIKDLNDQLHDSIFSDIKKQTKQFKKLDEWFTTYKQHIDLKDTMTKCIDHHKKYKKFSDELEKHTKQIKDIQNKKKDLKQTIQDLKLEANTFKHKLDILIYTVNYSHDIYTQFLYLSYQEWYTTSTNLKEQLEKLNQDLDEWKLYNHYIENIKPKKDLYEKLVYDHKLYSDWIVNRDQLKNIIDSHYLTETIYKGLDVYENLNFLQNAKRVSDIHKERLIVLDKLKQLEELHKKLIIDHSQTVSKYDQQVSNQNTIDSLIKFKNDIEKKKATVTKIKEYSNKYQEWLYNNHILPNIITMANNLILNAKHEHSQNIVLGYYMNDDGIEWMITTMDGIQLTVNKASGFQKFITSIALRIVIPKLQSKYYKCNQLFLDEGWTSADANNRSIVPQFLRSLLLEFESVILVSHIDEIRESVDHRIDISKDQTNNSHILL